MRNPMDPGAGFRQSALLLLGLALSCPGHAQSLNTETVPFVAKAPATNAPATNAPAAAKPAQKTPTPNKPAAIKPAANTPAAISPAASTPVTSKPAANAPAASTPVTSKPAANTPAASTPVTSKPAANFPATNTPAATPPPTNGNPGQPPAAPADLLLRQALQLVAQNQIDAALDKVNAALQAAPQNTAAYELRGTIYAGEKNWSRAEKDYQTALQMDGKDNRLKYNLTELQFLQKNYADARPGFVALEQDPNMDDLASYKVFLCDLLGGHEDVAARELDAFNRVGGNPSYYFANAAWSLIHHKTEDARGWLTTASKIYPSRKWMYYASSLIELGYMPLPPPPHP